MATATLADPNAIDEEDDELEKEGREDLRDDLRDLAIAILLAWRTNSLSDSRLRIALGHVSDVAGSELRGITERLATGNLTLARWHRSMLASLKPRQYEAALLTTGPEALSPLERQAVRQANDRQADFLSNFRQAIETGKQVLDGTALARSEMYGSSLWQTGWNVLRVRKRALGYTQARRILGGAVHHCGTCLNYAELGWLPIDQCPPIGDSECMSRCRCSIEFR